MVVNLVVFAVKLVPGLLIGSVSLVADAVHSLADVVTSGVVIWSFSASAKPPDEEHPFGHGRIENLASLVIAVLLLVAAVEFAVVSVRSLLHPRPVVASGPLLAALGLSILAKEWLARFSVWLGKKIASPVLTADAWHHRSDVLATVVVAAALVGERLGVRGLDGAAGMVVAGFIAVTAFGLIREAAHPLIGASPSPELLRTVRETVLGQPGVNGLHDLMIHAYGQLLVISLHAEVPAEISLARAHEIAEAVERALAERLGAVTVVHVDPVDRSHPLYPKVSRVLDEAVGEVEGLKEYHDLRIVCGETYCNVVLEVVVQGRSPDQVAAEVRHRIHTQVPEVQEVIVEPDRVLVF